MELSTANVYVYEPNAKRMLERKYYYYLLHIIIIVFLNTTKKNDLWKKVSTFLCLRLIET